MKKLSTLILAAGAMGAVALTTVPEAEAARSTSLNDSRLITDKNDIYLYPQLGVEYSRLLSFEYGPAQNMGSGLALFGDEELTFGVGLSRGDLTTMPNFFGVPGNAAGFLMPGIDNPTDGPDPFVMADLFASTDLGGGLLGARLSLGQNVDKDTNLDDETTGESTNLLGATIGYTIDDDMRIDTSATLQHVRVGITDETSDDDSAEYPKESATNIGLSARVFNPMNDDMDLGIIGDITYSSDSTTGWDFAEDEEGSTARTSNLMALAGAGPVYHTDDAVVAAYGVLGYQRNSTNPDTDEDLDRNISTNILFPGVHVSTEIDIRHWLHFRTGMQYSFQFDRTRAEADVEDTSRDDTVSSSRSGAFGWNAGVGVATGDFTLDGVFQHGFVTNGPAFLGGDAGLGGMFAMVAAGYQF